MKFKKLLTFMLAASVLCSSVNVPAWAQQAGQASEASAEAGEADGQETVTYKGVTFYRASAAYKETVNEKEVSYEGMPLFNGNSEDLDTYVDLIMEEIGVDGWINILAGESPVGTYQDSAGKEKTYNFPISIGRQADVGLDGETQWPNQLSQAQTWNLDLIKEAGSAFGDEVRSKSQTNTVSGTAANSAHIAQIDVRFNPLSGRYDEGFGEDAFMVGEMADAWAAGMVGDEDADGLYMKSVPETKHWTTYNSEFFRLQGGNSVSSRTFYEYYAKAGEKAFGNGTIAGYMSSYGNMNGVPATSTFIHDFAQKMSKNGLITGCDFMSEYGYLTEQYPTNASAFSNGYDETYSTSAVDRAASMILAGHKQGGNASLTGDEADTVKVIKTALENGVQGLTENDIKKVARPTVVTMVRTGALDERDENGQPRYYPYINDETNVVNRTSEENQQTELQMAEEGIVLLKNEDNALPLAKGQNAAVYGTMAEVFQYGQYSSEMTNKDGSAIDGYGDGAGDTVLDAIKSKNGEDKVQYATGNRVVAYKGQNGYLTAAEGDGAQLTTTDGADAKAEAKYQFEYVDWGQDAFSLFALSNSKWVKAGIKNNSLPGKTMGLTDEKVQNTGDYSMISSAGLATAVSNFPQFMTKQKASGKNNYYLKFGAKFNDTDFSTAWAMTDKLGWYMQANTDNTVSLNGEAQAIQGPDLPFLEGGNKATGVSAFQKDADKAKYTFTEETIKKTGADSADMAANTDYAIVVVGQPYNGISGEGVDRAYLNLSEDQTELAKTVAANYAKQGKKTILVINTEYPVEAEEFQNDDNISAIVFNPHGGEYDGKALANILYGDAAPTGRLVSTWYTSEKALPEIDKYAMPNNAMLNIGDELVQGLTLGDLDDAVTVDMTDADLQQNNLTYMYADPEDVTYEFGYGLSYSDFTYSNMKATAGGDKVKVQVTVKNNGNVTTSDVVQIYAFNPNSAYESGAAEKKLVGFKKVRVPKHGSKTISITVDAKALEVWDVNAKDYKVEPGTYQFYAAHSSDLNKDNVLSAAVSVQGDYLATADTTKPINVWSNSFDASNVKYVEYSKAQTAAAAAADTDEMFSVMSKGKGAWAAISRVNLDQMKKATLKVASTASSNTIELRLDSPKGKVIGTASFGKTSPVTQKRANVNADYDAGSYTELGYEDVTVDLNEVSGVHHVYVVFKNADARIATVAFAGTEAVNPQPGDTQTTVPGTQVTDPNAGNTAVSQTITVGKVSIKTLKTSGKKKLKVTYKRVKGAKGYQIRYATKSNMKSAKKLLVKKGTTTKKTISKLKSKKTYYVQVRAYKLDANGKKVYGKWSAKKKQKVK